MSQEPIGRLTAIAGVEMVLNSRPLLHVSTKDIEKPLILSHLLIGCWVLSLPNTVVHYSKDDGDDDLDLSNEENETLE